MSVLYDKNKRKDKNIPKEDDKYEVQDLLDTYKATKCPPDIKICKYH